MGGNVGRLRPCWRRADQQRMRDAGRLLRRPSGPRCPLDPVATARVLLGPRTTRGPGSGRRPPSPPPVTPTTDGRWGDQRCHPGGLEPRRPAPRVPPPPTGVWPGSPSSTRATRTALSYRWALLVAPGDGGQGLRRGPFPDWRGMVWYQGKLIVTAQTAPGGDDALLRLRPAPPPAGRAWTAAAIGKVRGGWLRRTATGTCCRPSARTARRAARAARARPGRTACFGSLSLDRTIDAGQPGRHRGGRRPTARTRTRLWRLPSYSTVAAARACSATDSLGRRRCAVEAYATKAAGLWHGVLSYAAPGRARPDWYVGHTPASGAPARQPVAAAAVRRPRRSRCSGGRVLRLLGRARRPPLSYWQETGELWSP